MNIEVENAIMGGVIFAAGIIGSVIVAEIKNRKKLKQFRANLKAGQMAWKKGTHGSYLKVLVTKVSADSVTVRYIDSLDYDTCQRSKLYPL